MNKPPDCKVNYKTCNISTFTVETVATDSCTGNVIAQNQYFDVSWILLTLIIIFFGAVMVALFN